MSKEKRELDMDDVLCSHIGGWFTIDPDTFIEELDSLTDEERKRLEEEDPDTLELLELINKAMKKMKDMQDDEDGQAGGTMTHKDLMKKLL